jgi:hypothetical protein
VGWEAPLPQKNREKSTNKPKSINILYSIANPTITTASPFAEIQKSTPPEIPASKGRKYLKEGDSAKIY